MAGLFRILFMPRDEKEKRERRDCLPVLALIPFMTGMCFLLNYANKQDEKTRKSLEQQVQEKADKNRDGKLDLLERAGIYKNLRYSEDSLIPISRFTDKDLKEYLNSK